MARATLAILGLAIVIPSYFVRETIRLLEKQEEGRDQTNK